MLCINPVAPHNLNNRPLVIPAEGTLQLVADAWENQFLLSPDSRMFILDGGRKVQVTTALFRLFLMNLEHKNSSAPCAQNALGVDPRDRRFVVDKVPFCRVFFSIAGNSRIFVL